MGIFLYGPPGTSGLLHILRSIFLRSGIDRRERARSKADGRDGSGFNVVIICIDVDSLCTACNKLTAFYL